MGLKLFGAVPLKGSFSINVVFLLVIHLSLLLLFYSFENFSHQRKLMVFTGV